MSRRTVRARLDEASDQALVREVRRLAEDPADTAERHAVMVDMDAVSDDWPTESEERARIAQRRIDDGE